MSKATIRVQGFVSRDATQREHEGTPVLSFSVPHTPRRLNRQTNQWEDAGPTLWVEVSVWGDHARLLAPHVRKGAHVVVEGEPSLRPWEANGKSGVNLDVRFATVSLIPRGEQAQAGSASEDAWAVPGDEVPF